MYIGVDNLGAVASNFSVPNDVGLFKIPISSVLFRDTTHSFGTFANQIKRLRASHCRITQDNSKE